MDALLQDLRFGLRLLARSPGTTLIVVLVLAIAIGANTVLFSVVYAKLLRPLPYPDADRLVQLWETSTTGGGDRSTLSPFDFRDWQDRTTTFDALAAYSYTSHSMAGPDGAERLRGVRVSGDFFSVLGVPPQLGRALTDGDDLPGSRLAVLGHAAWQQHFAGDPAIAGRSIRLDGEPYTVVAVMPADFRFPSARTDVWTSPAFDLAEHERSDHFLFGIARMKPGVRLAAAQADLDAVAERLSRAHPATDDASGALLVPLQEEVVGDVRREILLLWGGVVLVLLVACANVANLLMARMLERQGELSVRLALGGSRGRIVRQVLTESALLAFLGGAAGVALAAWTTRYLASGRGPAALRSERLELDGWVLGFSLLVTAATAFGFGIAPALGATRRDVAGPLREAGGPLGRATGRQALPRLLVAFQVCLAVVLLSAAGLLVRSLVELHRVDVGFEPSGVVTFRLTVPSSSHPSPAERARLFGQVVERIAAVPGVERAGAVNDLPFSGSRTQRSFDFAGGAERAREAPRQADYRVVVGDYFGALGLERMRGEGFAAGYREGAPRVAMVNEAFVSAFLSRADPLERRLVIDGEPRRIVGVVESSKHGGLDAPDAAQIYVPAIQGATPEWAFVVVRSRLGVDALAPALRAAVRDVVPEFPLYDFRTLEERIASSIAPQRFSGLIVSAFAAIALVLVLVGIYGLVSTMARQRTREIAIRMALGGRRTEVVRSTVLGGLVPAAVGIVAGALLALLAGRALSSLLFEVEPSDPVVLLAVPLLVAAVGVVATYVPALRATLVDPVTALREG